MIPPKEYAELTGAKYQTVMLWLRQDLLPGAQKFALPTGGHYYLIPADVPKPQTQRGPKPKNAAASPATEEKPAKPAKSARKPGSKKPAKKGSIK